jgi:hypothetical protein
LYERKLDKVSREENPMNRRLYYGLEILVCHWEVVPNDIKCSEEQSWELVQLVFTTVRSEPSTTLSTDVSSIRIFDGLEQEHEISRTSFGSLAFKFLWECISTVAKSTDGSKRTAIFIVPRKKGYVVRTDILALRLVDCQYVKHVTSLSESQKLYSGESLRDKIITIPGLLSACAAGMIITPEKASQDNQTILSSIEQELTNRLSFPWVSEHLKPRQTLAIVEGGRVPPENSGPGSVYIAAKAIGVDVVVLDNAGHWLEKPESLHLRKDFIPIRLPDPPDNELSSRIVTAVQQYSDQIDGIISFCDSYMSSVAAAAQELGLPTSTPEAFEIATNKYKTSVFVGHEAHRASSWEEAADIATKNDLSYPLIVKPCMGWSSEGVSRVDDFSMLETQSVTVRNL